MRTACNQLTAWHTQGMAIPTISVNLSAQQFLQADLIDQIDEVLIDTNLPASSLKLEITETMLMQDITRTRDILYELKNRGVKLSVDDFGTGYSSLDYLKRFPLNELKVDQTFVRDITTDPNDAAIVTAVIGLAHTLGLQVTVEGVETLSQLGFVQAREADVAQGYYFSRPLSAEALFEWLRHPPLLPLATQSETQTVLIIEDYAPMLEFLSTVIKRDGYVVVTAASAEEGFKQLAQCSIDIVLVDYKLPEMNGVEFLRRARAIYPEAIRIMLSGRGDLKMLASAVNEGGIFRFLFKPVDAAQLRATLREAYKLSLRGHR